MLIWLPEKTKKCKNEWSEIAWTILFAHPDCLNIIRQPVL
uniref:Uncharacterized protein n=1 Tax=Arundo donax TaxID=35708 RepID=A0A0A9BHM2_ARUDO